MANNRKLVASLAKKLYAGEITFDEFLLGTPEDDSDEEISELIDLIEHEPKRGGFMGVSPKKHDNYIEKINKLIKDLLE
jgi:hypothetical protein